LTAALLLLLAAEPGILRVQLSQRDGGKIADLPLETYVAAVVAGESGAFQSDEALKAMAVAVRTYGVRVRGRHQSQGYDLCSTTHCQFLDMRGVNTRLRNAAASTAGEMLWHNGKFALTYYSQDCGGRLEDAGALWQGSRVPYLKTRDDEYCVRAGGSRWQWSAEASRIADALRQSGLRVPSLLERIAVLHRTPSGRAKTLALAGGGESFPLSATSFRFALGRALGWNTVRSELWEVQDAGGRFLFQGAGGGHGAGLCQRGADRMGVEGRSYRDILNYYYPGAPIGVTAQGINWTRLSGERATLFTARPGRDSVALATADLVAAELGLSAPIEIRIYPDVDTFRNSTGEPGWVAARTAGRKIQLQPTARAALHRTLRHELLHIMIEERAAPNTPLWFREGLAAYLATRTPSTTTTGVTPDDAAIRQTTDAGRARQANTAALRRVAALVQRHGEHQVLEWLRQGLPPALM
jgi:stage II sporulation protein D